MAGIDDEQGGFTEYEGMEIDDGGVGGIASEGVDAEEAKRLSREGIGEGVVGKGSGPVGDGVVGDGKGPGPVGDGVGSGPVGDRVVGDGDLDGMGDGDISRYEEEFREQGGLDGDGGDEDVGEFSEGDEWQGEPGQLVRDVSGEENMTLMRAVQAHYGSGGMARTLKVDGDTVQQMMLGRVRFTPQLRQWLEATVQGLDARGELAELSQYRDGPVERRVVPDSEITERSREVAGGELVGRGGRVMLAPVEAAPEEERVVVSALMGGDRPVPLVTVDGFQVQRERMRASMWGARTLAFATQFRLGRNSSRTQAATVASPTPVARELGLSDMTGDGSSSGSTPRREARPPAFHLLLAQFRQISTPTGPVPTSLRKYTAPDRTFRPDGQGASFSP